MASHIAVNICFQLHMDTVDKTHEKINSNSNSNSKSIGSPIVMLTNSHKLVPSEHLSLLPLYVTFLCLRYNIDSGSQQSQRDSNKEGQGRNIS